jgi:hypothetical protein
MRQNNRADARGRIPKELSDARSLSATVRPPWRTRVPAPPARAHKRFPLRPSRLCASLDLYFAKPSGNSLPRNREKFYFHIRMFVRKCNTTRGVPSGFFMRNKCLTWRNQRTVRFGPCRIIGRSLPSAPIPRNARGAVLRPIGTCPVPRHGVSRSDEEKNPTPCPPCLRGDIAFALPVRAMRRDAGSGA